MTLSSIETKCERPCALVIGCMDSAGYSGRSFLKLFEKDLVLRKNISDGFSYYIQNTYNKYPNIKAC